MKKMIIRFIFVLSGILAFSGAFGALNAAQKSAIAVIIEPQKEIVKEILGELANNYEVFAIVDSGANPHDFEPKPSVLKKLSNAELLLNIGLEFEEAWTPRFAAQNPKMRIISVDNGIAKITGEDEHGHEAHSHEAHEKQAHKDSIESKKADSMHSHEKHEKHEAHGHEHENGDPHIWLSLKNARIIAKNTTSALLQISSLQSPKNKAILEQNLEKYLNKIAKIEAQITEILKPLKERRFVVFHPSLRYFARDFNLSEIAIEIDGKSPKMRDMQRLIDLIKKEKIKKIFVSPEFSTKSAEFIAKESGAQIAHYSPLQSPYLENLVQFAKNLAK